MIALHPAVGMSAEPGGRVAVAVRSAAESADSAGWKGCRAGPTRLGESARPAIGSALDAAREGGSSKLPIGAAQLLAVLADRFPRGFTARQVAARIDDADDLIGAGDAELKRVLEAAGCWRPKVNGAVMGQWLGRLVDRVTAGRVLRRGGIVHGYRRYHVELDVSGTPEREHPAATSAPPANQMPTQGHCQ